MVRTKFRDKTVLTIAHRLDTIMDSDQILSLEKGTISEFDSPYNLLKNRDGLLHSLVHANGEEAAAHLASLVQAPIRWW